MTMTIATSRRWRLHTREELARDPLEGLDTGDLAADTAVILPPADSPLPAKVVAAAGAAAWRDLAHPTAWTRLDRGLRDTLLPMIFDGAIEVHDNGSALVGPAATRRLAPETWHRPAPPGPDLGRHLLGLATCLPASTSATELSTLLYRGHTAPVGGGPGLVAPDPPTWAATHANWRWPDPVAAARSGWWMFWPRGPRPDTGMKLYVGLRDDDVVASLPDVVTVLAAHGAPPFKVAHGRAGMARSDKLVVYVDGLQRVANIGAAIDRRLAGLPVHPVPFALHLASTQAPHPTSQSSSGTGAGPQPEARAQTRARQGPGGRLNRVSTPPDPHAPPSGHVFVGSDPVPLVEFRIAATSWRMEVCTELAHALVVARHFGLDRAASVDAALARVAMVGIDPTTWGGTGWHLPSPSPPKGRAPSPGPSPRGVAA